MDKASFKRELNILMRAQANLDKDVDNFWKILQHYYEVDFSEIPSKACNADNLEEAINCYIIHGEHSPEELWEELQEAIKEE